MTEEDLKKKLVELEIMSELLKTFIEQPLGKYIMDLIDELESAELVRADNVDSPVAMRNYDAARGIRKVREAILYPLKAAEDGTLEKLRKDV